MKLTQKGFLLMLLTLLLLLTACGKTDEEILQNNRNKSLINEIVQTRLSNLSYEAQQEIFDEFRTRVDYEVWANKFDTMTMATQSELAVAEYYMLVPKNNRITKLVEEVNEDGYKYMVLAEMVAVPEHADLSDKSVEQSILFTYWFTFDKEGVLVNMHEKHRKDGIVQ